LQTLKNDRWIDCTLLNVSTNVFDKELDWCVVQQLITVVRWLT